MAITLSATTHSVSISSLVEAMVKAMVEAVVEAMVFERDGGVRVEQKCSVFEDGAPRRDVQDD